MGCGQLTGVTLTSVVMRKCTSKFPIPLNRSGYVSCELSMHLIDTLFVTAQLNVTIFKSRDVGRTCITSPGVSIR